MTTILTGPMKDTPHRFADKWAVASVSAPCSGPESLESLAVVEKALNFTLPTAYVEFMQNIGSIWTPHILDSVVDYESDLPSLAKIHSVQSAAELTKDWQQIMLPEDLFAFASDAGGNMFCFRISQCTSPRNEDLPVYFFDHDFKTTEKVADSFEGLLLSYVNLSKSPEAPPVVPGG